MKKLSLIFLVLVFFAIGCKFGSLKDLVSGGASGSNSSRGSSTGGSDPKEDIIQASKKFIALPAFSAKMEGLGQTASKSQVDYVAPDRYHIMYLGGTGAGIEMIMIGNQSYMKTTGKWTKIPGNAKAIPTLRDSFTDEGLKTLSEVKFDGEDTVDGKPAYTYSYKNVTPVGNYPFSSKIWIGKDTGLPMKIVVDYTNGVLKQMTVNYDTESPVKIEAPIN
jgi:outer membrane lipoprotein-sorting protein